MEGRGLMTSPRAGAQQPGSCSFVTSLQEKFMTETGKNPTIAAFYESAVKPLLEQNEFKDLGQIESLFAEKIRSLNEVKKIDKDIIEGYTHVLTLYKLYTCFQFLQVSRAPSAAQEVLSPLSPQSPRSPLSASQAASSRPRELSTEFKTLQSLVTKRLLGTYQEQENKWAMIPFEFDASEWTRKAQALNETIHVFNRTLVDFKPAAIDDNKAAPIEEITQTVLAEKELADFLKNIQPVIQRSEELMRACSTFKQGISAAIIVLEQGEKLHCERLRHAPISLAFLPAEFRLFQQTAEYQIVKSNQEKRITRYSKKNAGLEARKQAIELLLKNLQQLEKPFAYTSILSGVSQRHRIFILLREFKANLEEILSHYIKALQEAQVEIESLSAAVPQMLSNKLKLLRKYCKAGIQQMLAEELKPLQAAAIAKREQSHANYLLELRPKLEISAVCDVTSLQEAYEEKARNLDAIWNAEFKSIVDSAQKDFISLQSTIRDDDNREIVQKNIKALETLYKDVELARLRVLQEAIDKVEELNRTVEAHGSVIQPIRWKMITVRGKKLLQFLDSHFSLFLRGSLPCTLQVLETRWVSMQIISFQKRYSMIKKLQFNLEIAGLKSLLKEIRLFKPEHTTLSQSNKVTLEQMALKIASDLTYHNQARQENKKAAREYKTNLLALLCRKPEDSARRLREAINDAINWRRTVETDVTKMLQGQENLPLKLNYIAGPIDKLKNDLQSIKPFTKPAYSCGWAFFWTIMLPIFGYCFYQWWYQRQCRLAKERYIEEELSTRAITSPDGASAEAKGRRLSTVETSFDSSAQITESMLRQPPLYPYSASHHSRLSSLQTTSSHLDQKSSELDRIEENPVIRSQSEAQGLRFGLRQAHLLKLASQPTEAAQPGLAPGVRRVAARPVIVH